MFLIGLFHIIHDLSAVGYEILDGFQYGAATRGDIECRGQLIGSV